jgi:branched-chain amino acid transport system permease protein
MTAMAAWVRQIAATAGIALLLGIPFIGLTTLNTDQGLQVATRWPALALFVAAIVFGRIALDLVRPLAGRLAPRLPAPPRLRVPGGAGLLLALAGLALPFLPFADRYVLDLGTTVLIYMMLGAGLNVTVGLAGLLDLGFVAFYAIGAYTCAILTTRFGLGFWQTLPLAGLVAAGVGVLLAFPILRLRGDYLAIVTLGFGEITRIFLLNWQGLTGGPNGLSGIPRPTFFGLTLDRRAEDGHRTFHQLFGIEYSPEHRLVFFYLIILALVLLANLVVARLRRLPLGRAWEALREDEVACRSLGIDPRAAKVSAYATGALLGGLAGAFFATRQGFVSPESFTFLESAMVLAIVVLGGLGSQLGVVIASLFLVLLPELGRQFADYRMLVFGAAMVLVMIWRPGGLLSGRLPTLRLGPPRQSAAKGQAA